MKELLAGISLLCSFAGNGYAVNYYDGIRAPKGWYFLSYTSFYTSDQYNNARGDLAIGNYGFTRSQELIGLSHYSPGGVFSAYIPVARESIGLPGNTATVYGVGDPTIALGHFFPVTGVDILPVVVIKIPIGAYDADKSVNAGSNQWDIIPMVSLYKAIGNVSVDAAIKYSIRLENAVTTISPGNELYLQALIGYRLTRKVKIGPALNWMGSSAVKLGGKSVPRTARESLGIGADVYYRLKKAGLTFTYARDLYARNMLKGHFFQLRSVYKF